MAIDTAHKRFSIMLEPGEMGWPPSSGIDAADRAVMLEWYSGIAAEAQEVATTYHSERWRVYVPSHDDAVAVFLPAAAPVIRVYVPDHDDAWEVTIP